MTEPHKRSVTMQGAEPEGYFFLAVKVNQTGYAHVLCCQTCGSLVGNTIAHNALCEYGKGSGAEDEVRHV